MSRTSHSRRRFRTRGGTATVEFALVLPLLMVLVVGALDFCRLFYHYTIVANCARNGALYASDETAARDSPYTFAASQRDGQVRAAALADASNLTPAPKVELVTDSATQVAVRVTYPFTMITSYFGLGPVMLSRTVRMDKAPALPG